MSLTSCSEGIPAPALLADLFRSEGRQREGTRPCKCCWFIPALVQWNSFAGSGGMISWRDPLRGWEKDECCSLHSVEPALERSCVTGRAMEGGCIISCEGCHSMVVPNMECQQQGKLDMISQIINLSFEWL